MKVILLAAGLGTRLRPITDSLPKCLVKINGIPLLKIWIEKILQAGIKDILINTHYLPDSVISFLKSEGYLKKIKIVHEPILLGTAGTLLKNLNFINNDQVMVIHADNLSVFDFDKFIKAHNGRPSKCNMTMMLFKSDDPQSCGIVNLDETGVVIEFYEKVLNPPSNLANAAIYIFEPSVIKGYLKSKSPITDISTQIIPNQLGKIYTFLNTSYHRDIGNAKSLALANEEFSKL